VTVGTEAEMLNSLSGILRSSEEEGVGTGGASQCKLIKGEDFTSSSLDSGSGGGGEAKSCDAHLWDGKETVVISDGTDNNDGLRDGLVLSGWEIGRAHQTGEGDRGAVNARHKEAAEHDFVEVGVGTTCLLNISLVTVCHGRLRRTSQEAIKLHEELEVDIVTFGGLAVAVPDVMSVEINT
jgi:hypothetical protein